MRVSLVAIFLIPLALVGCRATTASVPPVAESAKPMLTSAELRPLTDAEKKILGASLAKGLKDPDSARWEWTGFPRSPGPGVVHYCGMVNAKNSYGGYVGSKPYIAVLMMNNGKILGGAIGALASASGDDAHIRKMCRDEGLDPYQVI